MKPGRLRMSVWEHMSPKNRASSANKRWRSALQSSRTSGAKKKTSMNKEFYLPKALGEQNSRNWHWAKMSFRIIMRMPFPMKAIGNHLPHHHYRRQTKKPRACRRVSYRRRLQLQAVSHPRTTALAQLENLLAFPMSNLTRPSPVGKQMTCKVIQLRWVFYCCYYWRV